jgi:hypothetical protein
MVSKSDLPVIVWDEGFGPADERRVTELIMATMNASLLPQPSGRNRLFFVVPTPAPYANAEANLFAAIGADAAQELRVLPLPRGGKCYVTSSEERLRALLPHAFQLGPPELTLIAANCDLSLAAPEGKMTDFVLGVLKRLPSTVQRDVVGMHFDSGDLVELF